jgi:hypothetical protein
MSRRDKQSIGRSDGVEENIAWHHLLGFRACCTGSGARTRWDPRCAGP